MRLLCTQECVGKDAYPHRVVRGISRWRIGRAPVERTCALLFWPLATIVTALVAMVSAALAAVAAAAIALVKIKDKVTASTFAGKRRRGSPVAFGRPQGTEL